MNRLIFIIIVFFAVNVNAGTEKYMNIKLGNSKIGYYVSKTDTVQESITVNETSEMKLTVFDNSVDVKGQNLTIYDSNYNLVKFFSSVISEQMTFFSNGFTENDYLIVKTILGNSTFFDTFNIKNKTIIFNMEFIGKEMMDKELFMFNPISREMEELSIKSMEPEDGYDRVFNITGKSTGSKVFFIDNEIIKSISREGIVMEKTESSDTHIERMNIIDYFLIQTEGDFKGIKDASSASYIIYSVENNDLENYRQIQKGDTLIVTRKPVYVPEVLSVCNEHYVKSNDEIKGIVKTLKHNSGNDYEMLESIMDYVHKRLRKNVVSGLMSIDEILEMNSGDCTEHAQLFAAIALEAGYNTDIVTGLVYNDNAFYYHAWNRVLINNVILTIDATFGQFESDVTHIQLSTGYPPSTILIGKLQDNVKIKLINKE